VPLGILAAVRENTAFDRAVQVVTLLGQAMPSFWLGLLLMITLGLQLGWLRSRHRLVAALRDAGHRARLLGHPRPSPG